MEKNADFKDDGLYAELLSIAVSPALTGSGFGKALIERFEEEAKKRGCKRVALTTDFNNNNSVISFYKKSGYIVYYEFTAYPARRMYKLVKDLA